MKPDGGGSGSRGPLLVAVTLAAVIAGITLVVVAGRHGPPTAAPSPSASISPLPPGPTPRSTFFDLTPAPTPRPPGLPSSVTSGIDVVYVEGAPGSPAGVEAIDWSGRAAGVLQYDTNHFRPDPSPDGRWLLIGNDLFRSDGSYSMTMGFDAFGSVWSRDSSHLCALSSGMAVIVASPLGGESVSRAAVSVVSTAAPRVLGCSPDNDLLLLRTDRALADGQSSAVDLVAVTMSTGRIKATIPLCAPPQPCGSVELAPAPDMLSAVAGGDALPLRRLDTATGAGSGLGGLGEPIAISGDGRRVLIQRPESIDPPPKGNVRGVALVDVATGTTVWARPGVVTIPSFVVTHTGHPELLIGVAAKDVAGPGGIFPPGPVSLVLVDARGATRTVLPTIGGVLGSQRG